MKTKRKPKAKPKAKPTKPKIDPIEAARIDEVFKAILLGAEFHDLREYADAPERKWEVTDDQLRAYQRKALERLRGEIGEDKDLILTRHILQRRSLYARAIEGGDWGTALSIARDEARLLDLYPPAESEKPKPPPDCTQPGKIDHVLKMILSGATEHDVAVEVKTLWPKDDHKPLIVAAMANLNASSNFDPSLVIGFCFEATREIHRRMLEAKDHGGALKAIKQISELTKYVRADETDEEEEETEQTTPPADSRAIPAGQGPREQSEPAEDSQRPGDRANTAGEESGA